MKSNLSISPPKPGESYQHQNGVSYRILALARVDNEAQDLMVVAIAPDGISWARPIGNFMGLKNGRPRFTKVNNAVESVSITVESAVGINRLMDVQVETETRLNLEDGTALYVRRVQECSSK